jgi:molecular chaperone HtpG
MSAEDSSAFEIGIDFERILAAISKQIYETPLAFLRENVQNAVDAIRIQSLRENLSPGNEQYQIDVNITGNMCSIRDNGIGMTREHLRHYFWTIGASGKRNEEARAAGCVGMFGIGGFANLGVCDDLRVISQVEAATVGTETSLSEADIKSAKRGIPLVKTSDSEMAAPRGTVILGHLRNEPNLEELEQYLTEFVQFSQENVLFNGKLLSRRPLLNDEDLTHIDPVEGGSPSRWRSNGIEIAGRLLEGKRHSLCIELLGLQVDGIDVAMNGLLRFDHGPIDVFKRGFKLCATKIETLIGISGRIDCERLSPTAGRDSLDAESMSLLSRIFACLEWIAVSAILRSTDRIAQNSRIFPYIIRNGWFQHLGNQQVRLADGAEVTLESLKKKAEGGVVIYYGRHNKQALNQIMQARGNVVVLLSPEHNRQQAEIRYLEAYCKAKQFEGIVECSEFYDDLTRFDLIFMSELETNIEANYDIPGIRIRAGKITEDIPVYVPDLGSSGIVDIFVDTKHPEVRKLEPLGFSPLFYSMVAAFTREYLGPTLRAKSPKFFGSGAISLESLAKRRSELWVLLKEDVGILSMAKQKEVVRSTDIQVMKVGEQSATHQVGQKIPKILQIIDTDESLGISGYYLRIPDGASKAYGDVIRECDNRGAVWAGNKILLVASDAISSAFQFEIRLDRLVMAGDGSAQQGLEGAVQLPRPIQLLHDGLYFPIPDALNGYLVPRGDQEIRIEIRCDWIDMKTVIAREMAQ